MRTGAHIRLRVRLWVCHAGRCQFPLPRAQSDPLHLGLECSICSDGPGTLMCITPHSTNTVSREQLWSNVCNGELESLCAQARRAWISPTLPPFFTRIET